MNILAATIVFCFNVNLYINKPNFNSPFLNPGGITSEPQEIVAYIKNIQQKKSDLINKLSNEIKNTQVKLNKSSGKQTDESLLNLNLVYREKRKNLSKIFGDSYGNVFKHAKNIQEITIPVLIGLLINDNLIDEKKLKNLQALLLYNYPELYGFILPSREKIIDIPLEILAKFYIKMYTEESNFYKDMNRILTHSEGFEIYKEYIFLLYIALHKKTANNYGKSKLYRGGLLTKKEFDEMMELWNDKIKREKEKAPKTKIDAILYYANNFLSFSKKEKECEDFIEKPDDNSLVSVKFIVDEIKESEDFFIANLDISQFSKYTDEEEVLFLPLSCFEMTNLTKETIKGINVSVIHLKYLNEYKKEIDQHIKTISKKELQVFFEQSLQSDFGKVIYKDYGYSVHESLKAHIEKESPLKISLQKYDIEKTKKIKCIRCQGIGKVPRCNLN